MGHKRIAFRLSWDYLALPFAIGAGAFNGVYEMAIQVGPLGVSILLGKETHD